jgi:hypothetical protein
MQGDNTAAWVFGILIGCGLVAAAVSWRRLNPITGAIILSVCGALLIPIFSVDPIHLDPRLTVYASNAGDFKLPEGAHVIIEKENEKAVAEIKLRSEQEDTWFKAKFVLVGTLLASAITFLGLASKDASAKADVLLKAWLRSPSLFAVLSFACVVTIGIDVHLRSNMSVAQQLGLWITYYVEPALLRTSYPSKPPSSPATQLPPAGSVAHERSGYLGWEQFLRVELEKIPPSAKNDVSPRIAGMQADSSWGIVVWSHSHYLTAVVYMLLLVLFQNLASRAADIQAQLRHVVIFGFAMVHVGLALLALSSHLIPPIFSSTPLIRGFNQPYFPVAIVLVLAVLNLPFLVCLGRRYPGRSSPRRER